MIFKHKPLEGIYEQVVLTFDNSSNTKHLQQLSQWEGHFLVQNSCLSIISSFSSVKYEWVTRSTSILETYLFRLIVTIYKVHCNLTNIQVLTIRNII